MARQAPKFDAQCFDAECDLAALVFGKPDEPDRMLAEFVQDLVTRGYRVVGLIQTRLGDGGAAVTVLPTGETIPLAPRRGSVAPSSRPDPCDLAQAAERIDALIPTGADLVIINRFGKLEAEGTGLVDEIARALSFDIPVLVAVPEFRFSEWLSFCKGMGVKLPCRNGSLQTWWNAMIVGEPRSAQQQQRLSVCERSK
jgi:nucleoside-triphosphatase THEP1